MHLFLARILSAIIGFVGVVYFSRVLGATVLGTYFMFFSVLGVLNLLADMGLSIATVKRMSEQVDVGQYLSVSVILRLFAVVMLALIVLVVREPLESYIGAEVAVELIGVLVVMQLSELSISALRGGNRIVRSAYVEILRDAVKVISQIVLVLYSFEVFGLVWGLGVGFVVSAVAGFIWMDTSPKKPQLRHFGHMLRFSKYSFIHSFSGLVYEWFDLLVIGWLLSSYYVGVYGVCWAFSMVAMLLSEAIALSTFPSLSNLFSRRKEDETTSIVSDSLAYTSIISIPAFAGTLVLSEDILSSLYGQEFSIGWQVLIILMMVRVVHSIQVIVVRVIEAADRPDIIFRISLIVMLLNIVADVVLIHFLGFIGAAIATLVSMSVFLMVGYHYMKKIVTVTVPIKNIGYQIAGAGTMVVIIELVQRSLQTTYMSDISILVIMILCGCLWYVAFLFTFDRRIRGAIYGFLHEEKANI